eukprot:3389079-Amphidinium_carterae.1
MHLGFVALFGHACPDRSASQSLANQIADCGLLPNSNNYRLKLIPRRLSMCGKAQVLTCILLASHASGLVPDQAGLLAQT